MAKKRAFMAKKQVDAAAVKQDMDKLAKDLRALKAKEKSKTSNVNKASIAGIDSILATLKHIGAVVSWE